MLKNFMQLDNTFNNLFYKRNNCRICFSKHIELALEIGSSPISEKYVTKDDIKKKQ